MDVISSQSRTVSRCQHWTVPASHEETWAVQKKFQRIGWRPPNYKPKTKKGVAWAKNVWDRYCDHRGVDPDQHLRQSGPADFESWIYWTQSTTKKKTDKSISQLWKSLCQAYSLLAERPIDCDRHDARIDSLRRQVLRVHLNPASCHDYGLRGLHQPDSDPPEQKPIVCPAPTCRGLVLQGENHYKSYSAKVHKGLSKAIGL